MVDSKGLITQDRGDELANHKIFLPEMITKESNIKNSTSTNDPVNAREHFGKVKDTAPAKAKFGTYIRRHQTWRRNETYPKLVSERF